MEITFGQKYWGVVLAAAILIAIVITLLIYHRKQKNDDLSPLRRRILMFLRFFSVFFLTMLLAIPLVRTLRKIVRHPLIILAVDNSRSMTGLEGSDTRIEELNQMVTRLQSGLSDRYEVVSYGFGSGVMRGSENSYTAKSSDYSQLLNTVYDNHFNENIGAMVIVGDGNFNQGENPVATAGRFSFPVYTLATGDTTPVRDARIVDLKVNRTAFAGNLFPLEVDLKITGGDQEPLLFSIMQGGERLISQPIVATGDSWFSTLSLTLPAEGKGLQYYTAIVETLPGEQNLTNNSWPFVINILENKQKILILSSGVHPDAGAIKNALDQQINYEVSLITEEPYPLQLEKYNLIILNQLPTSSQSMRSIVEESRVSRIPLLVIVGGQTYLSQLNAMGLGVTITPRAGNFEEAQMSVREDYTPFTLSDELKAVVTRFPPLKVPFAGYELDASFHYLGYQRIKNIVTPAPLIATGNVQGRKVGFLFGEGVWRWRMYNYAINESHSEFNELFDKLTQYLALRDNEDNFIVSFKPVYSETEPVQMTAEVYNEAYELINTPDVTIMVTDSAAREFPYIFDRSQLYYKLDAGVFPPGRYRFTASVETGKESRTETGEFAVIPVNMELADLRANHAMLYRLAMETGGKFFTEEEAKQLEEEIRKNNSIQTVSYFQPALSELLQLRYLFFLFLLFLSTEWFLRKYWGLY